MVSNALDSAGNSLTGNSFSKTGSSPKRDNEEGGGESGFRRRFESVIRGNNEYRKSEVVKAMRACEKNNIVYLNFMVYFPNSREYISNRLRKNIG